MRTLYYFWRGFSESPLRMVSKPLWSISTDFREKELQEHSAISKAYLVDIERMLDKSKGVSNGKNSKPAK